MKKYFISYVLQEEGKQDIFGNADMSIHGKIDTRKLQEVLSNEIKNKLLEKTRRLIVLNIVKL